MKELIIPESHKGFMKLQKVTEHNNGWNKIVHIVSCGECGKTIGLNDSSSAEATGLAWFDPYNKNFSFKGGKGCYVHFECLSDTRKKEIENAN